jgi:PTH1 family peptidyl-tRNA hydrolase
MKLVVGLGNPGPKYAGNRHNVGFMVLDRLAARAGAGPFRDKFQGRLAQGELGHEQVALLAPLTYMNLSGESVQKAMAFFKVPLGDVIVVHDELDLPWRDSRIKVGGGAAGHNGLRSIIQHCGGPDFVRVRVGIGRPKVGTVESYVLSDFDAMERAELPDEIERACDLVEAVVTLGAQAAMNAKHGAGSKPGGAKAGRGKVGRANDGAAAAEAAEPAAGKRAAGKPGGTGGGSPPT